MTGADLFRESFAALRGNRSRTVLTGLGVIVGTLALVLILSLSLGLSHVIDDLVASDEQLRQVVVIPGFGARMAEGEKPHVEGEMDDAKRRRLERTLAKRSHGGPALQLALRSIDLDMEKRLAAIPGVERVQPVIQDRFEVTLETEAGPKPLARDVLSFCASARHSYYPRRLLAGRWFESDTEQAVVVHELLLYDLGYTSDAAQAALVGKRLRLTARERPRNGMMEMIMGSSLERQNKDAPELFSIDVPIVGVIRERSGDEPASIVEESWIMQTDLFLPQEFARDLWNRVPSREGLRGLILIAKDLDQVDAIEQATERTGLRARSVRAAMEQVKTALSGATIVAGFLAAIAIFVSGLGIVNTLVMSVLERTREIGLLKALGARDRTVAALFLCEGALIGLFGGAIGVALSYGVSVLGDAVARTKISEALFMPFDGTLFVFPWWLAAGGVAFAVVTSLSAAVLPAIRAARIDPVRALRNE